MAQRVGSKIEPHFGAESLTMAIQVCLGGYLCKSNQEGLTARSLLDHALDTSKNT